MSLVDLGKRLLESAKRGDTDDVRTLMSNGAPFTTDWLGTSPLHFSAQFGHISTAEVLLRAGISRDARTKVDRTPLHVAAQEGHVEIVNLLLQHAADIDAKDMLKMTPLHWSTEKGHLNVVEVLLKAGADVNCENKFDKTPLDIAIINGRPDIVQSIQLAQHTAVGSLQEPTETVTVETSEVGETAILDGGDHISIEGHSIATDTEDSNLLLQNMRTIKTEVSDESAEEGNSTSVLATLAALAEATAQNNNTNTNQTEAINWLESQGITMITTSDGNIITSAVESGQTITLTEAGKIALNIIKNQGLEDEEELNEMADDKVSEHDKVITYVTEGEEMPVEESSIQIQSVTTIAEADGTQTVITEVEQDESQPEEEMEDDGDGEPPAKMARLVEQPETTEIDVDALLQKSNEAEALAALAATDDAIPTDENLHTEEALATDGTLHILPTEEAVHTHEATEEVLPTDEALHTEETIATDGVVHTHEILPTDGVLSTDGALPTVGAGDGAGDGSSEISDQEKLRRELEAIKRQAEEFKLQLKQKDKDLEEYKKQLGEISDKSDEAAS